MLTACAVQYHNGILEKTCYLILKIDSVSSLVRGEVNGH